MRMDINKLKTKLDIENRSSKKLERRINRENSKNEMKKVKTMMGNLTMKNKLSRR